MVYKPVLVHSVALRKHGLIWAELGLVEGLLGKCVQLHMQRAGESTAQLLLEISVVGDRLIYSSRGDSPVLGESPEEPEHAPKRTT